MQINRHRINSKSAFRFFIDERGGTAHLPYDRNIGIEDEITLTNVDMRDGSDTYTGYVTYVEHFVDHDGLPVTHVQYRDEAIPSPVRK